MSWVSCIKEPMTLYFESDSTRLIATNSIFHERTKHFEVDVQLVSEKIESKEIRVQYIHTSAQLTDFVTKTIFRDQNYLNLYPSWA